VLNRCLAVFVLVAALGLLPMTAGARPAKPPAAHVAATCDDYESQADAQRAADTRDADGDGIYCEDLPCPCSTEASGGGDGQDTSCTKPIGVQRLVFDEDKYANIRKHFRIGLRKGWPRRLIVNRRGADARRDRLLEDIPTKDGFDRDEYPPAVGRGRGKGLERGRNPRGWKAHVRYVPSAENRSHGAALGAKLDDFCNGTRFRYVFR
jgi:hypothetical protein